MKHLVWSHRGLLRERFGMFAPASLAPPRLALAAFEPEVAAAAPAPDTS